MGYPLCELWMSINPQHFDMVHASIAYALYFLWLLVCILLGTNRNRTLVGAAFLLCFGFIVQMPLGFFIGYVAFPSHVPHFLETLHQFPKLRYALLFFVNCSITGCCFLAVHWFKKIQLNQSLKLCVTFTLAFIINTAINQVWWNYSITTINNIPLIVLASLGLLLTAMPFFIMYLFIRFATHAESYGVQTTRNTLQINETVDVYAQFIQRLSNRELEVVEAILAGNKKYKEIASLLNISVNTVKFHLKNIYQITGVSNVQALFFLFRNYNSNS